MRDEDFQVGGELGDFGLPIADEGGRDDEEGRRFRFFLPSKEQGDDLQCFAQAHVIGQTGAKAEASQKLQPCKALELIRTHGRAQIQRRCGLGRRAHLMEQMCEIFARHDFAPVVHHFRASLFHRRLTRIKAREQAHAVEETDAAFARGMLNPLPVRHHLLELGPVDFDPAAAE